MTLLWVAEVHPRARDFSKGNLRTLFSDDLFWTNPFIQKHSGRFFVPLKLEMTFFFFFQFQEVSDSVVFVSFHVQSVWRVWRGHSSENYTSAPKRKQRLPTSELPGCCGWKVISISGWGRGVLLARGWEGPNPDRQIFFILKALCPRVPPPQP